MARTPHEYRPDIPFTEPPVDDEDTKEYTYIPVKVEPPPQPLVARMVRMDRAQLMLEAFASDAISLSSVEIDYLIDVAENGVDPLHMLDDVKMAIEPLQPLELTAAQQTNWMAEGARSLARWLNAWADRRGA